MESHRWADSESPEHDNALSISLKLLYGSFRIAGLLRLSFK